MQYLSCCLQAYDYSKLRSNDLLPLRMHDLHMTISRWLNDDLGTPQLFMQFPDCYEEAVIKLVHHATLKEDELSQRVLSYFKDRFVPGEAVLGITDGEERMCQIITSLEPVTAGHDCGSLHSFLSGGLSEGRIKASRLYPASDSNYFTTG